ncbi:MAG: 2-succinyl-5-enolpyruvyl-6-hydroxy-3-cyclohexene-1-carboxylic-acid synthase [Nannocystaceae bacterium]
MSQAEFVARLVDGLVRGGARRAVLSPGYRCAPISLALRAHAELRCEVIVDERVAGFYALGLARARGEPVILACTSGSAVANYLPAVVEAQRARIPLVLLTADRPPELQRAGAAQTMAQRGVFADFVVWADELAEPPALDEDVPRAPWDARVAQAMAAARADDGGPIHLNLPVRKPLLPEAASPPRAAPPRLLRGRRSLPSDALAEVAARFAGAQRPVLVAGPMIRALDGEAAATGAALVDLAARSGWPLVADLLAHCRPSALQVGDAIGRRAGPEEVADAILWFGDAPVSAPLMRWIGRCEGPVVQVSPGGAWRDPTFAVDLMIDADAAELAAGLELPLAPPAWRRQIGALAQAAEAALAGAATGRASFNWEGPALGAALAAWPGAVVHVANSTAIRDLDTFGRLRPGQRALCNRGLNGIDGTVATAAGEAAAIGEPLLAIVGDLALAHDLGALVHAPATSLVILAVDNGGGQIFRQLPLRDHPDFDELFVTPTPLDLAAVAAATGWSYVAVDPGDGLRLAEALATGYECGRTIVGLRFDPEVAAAARGEFWRQWR